MMKVRYTVLAAAALAVGLGGCMSIQTARYQKKAQAAFEQGDCAQVAELIQKSFDVDFEFPDSHMLLGQCYEQTHKPVEAIEQYRFAVRYAPTMHEAQLALIRLLTQQGQTDQADEAAERYIPYMRVSMKQFLTIADNFAAAGLDRYVPMVYQAAATMYPTDAAAYVALGDFYMATGDKAKAAQALLTALEVDPVYPGLAAQLGAMGYRVDLVDRP